MVTSLRAKVKERFVEFPIINLTIQTSIVRRQEDSSSGPWSHFLHEIIVFVEKKQVIDRVDGRALNKTILPTTLTKVPYAQELASLVPKNSKGLYPESSSESCIIAPWEKKRINLIQID